MKSKVLFLASFYHDASSRFRVEAYVDNLKKDYEIKIIHVSERPKNIPKFLKSLYKKLFLLYLALGSSQYDAIFIHRAVSSYKNSLWFEKILSKFNKNIIFEYDDSIFLHNEQKISSIILLSKSIICGNDYLKNYALKYNPNSFVIPTAIDTDLFTEKLYISKNTITVGWTGTSSNYQFFSAKLIEQISELLNIYKNVHFLFICDTKPDNRFNFNYEFIKWKADSEIKDLQKIDIGLMPLEDNEWTKGKCGFKLIQYGAIGIPALGSNVGVNPNIISNGTNGFIIDNDNWYEKLETLITDDHLRKNMGKKAREIISKNYSIKVTYEKLRKVIDDTINH